jgi:hypothetical protein
MKNTIKSLGIAAIVLAMVFAMIACDDGDSHEHDYSGAWQKDATHHWKVCAADGEVGEKDAHSPADGICSTCGYDSHKHDFSGTWQKDATDHWKVCIVGGEIGQKAAHSYNASYTCTVCEYQHTHDFSGAWQKDATNHWKVCAADGAIGQKAVHTPTVGNCTICAYHTHDFSGAWQKDATHHWKECAADSAIEQKALHNYTNGICTVCNAFQYAIGDTGPASGIIFYVSADGFTMTGTAGTFHYLEASPANLTGGTGSQTTMRWTTETSTITSLPNVIGTNTILGAGKNATALIIAAESAAYPGNTYIYAARACSEYRGGGKDDWFLPSRTELIELYNAKGKPGIPTTGWFWSSTQELVNSAYALNFSSSALTAQSKVLSSYNVRAVRAF